MMSNALVVKCGGKVVIKKENTWTPVKSRWSGELEETRKHIVVKMAEWLAKGFFAYRLGKVMVHHAGVAFAATGEVVKSTAGQVSADHIRDAFQQLLDVFTAISEPILWFYALTACIMMATKNKDKGWERLKNVAYAYGAISLIPTFFAFVRWIAELIKGSITF